MNKKNVDEMIPKAVAVLQDCKIAKDGEISKTYRGQISTFGAAINGGSLLAATAFFSSKGNASVDRENLSKAIYSLIKKDTDKETTLYAYVENQVKLGKESTCKAKIVEAAIALKLAMNVYQLID